MSDPQSEWAELLLTTLAEAGVRDVVISPGSRSTPLVWAACRVPVLRRHILIDERSAAFYALGQARVSGTPSLLICTSGSAPSHYFPAVIEAHESGTPMIVLSADRPFELQQCGAAQTIDQAHLFGRYATYFELGTPVRDREARLGLRRTAWQAVATASEWPRGAVHLNFRAKKPLEPQLDEPPSEPLPPVRPVLSLAAPRPVPAADLSALLERLAQSRCPLLICGALSLQEAPDPELVRRFVALSGCVVCPEAVSQLRFQLAPEPNGGVLCDGYDWLLGNGRLAKRLQPDFALQLGAAPLSAGLGRLIADAADTLDYTVCAEGGWPDPLHKSAHIVRARPKELLEALCQALAAAPPRSRAPATGLWHAADRVVREVLNRPAERFGEPEAVATVCDALPAGSFLALGNSLPPRLVDRYCPAAERGIRVLCQRGASGIEGLIAGALGAASQADAQTTLLMGDISFLHDVGSLWAARPEQTHAAAPRHPLLIVVINNGGGRIFEQLPVAELPGVDQNCWVTPHALRLRSAAELYGVTYFEARGREDLRAALESASARARVSMIEVLVEPASAALRLREVNAELERRFLEMPLESP